MKNIFDLTKREQRLVIMIVAALVTAAPAKHFFGEPSAAAARKSLLRQSGYGGPVDIHANTFSNDSR